MDRVAVAREIVKVAKLLAGMEFPTEKALKEYLREHPKADRSLHSVEKGKSPNVSKQDFSVKENIEKGNKAIQSGKPHLIFDFVETTKGVDLKPFEDAIIEIGKNPKQTGWITSFAAHIKGADVKRLQDAVIKTGNADAAYNFARDVEGADVKRLQDVVIKAGNPKWIHFFKKDVKGADKALLQKELDKKQWIR